MPQVDFASRNLICKIVYYGPGLGGKTTNLKHLHTHLPAPITGRLMSLQTDLERTLFFDFFPASLGTIGAYQVRLHFFTVPGQSFYNATRKNLLQNVDGVVFVADSHEARLDANLDSLDNLEENLQAMGRGLSSVPLILQYNKRDLPGALPVEELRRTLNPLSAPEHEATATEGAGVFETQRSIVKSVLAHINDLVKV